MEKKWDVTIDFVAMMGGQFSCSGEPYLSSKQVGITTQEVQDLTILSPKDCIEQKYYRSIAENGIDNKAPYMLATGRFMLTTEQQAVQKNTIKRIAQQLKKT